MEVQTSRRSLTESDKLEIKKSLKAGLTNKEIAETWNVNPQVVCGLRKRFFGRTRIETIDHAASSFSTELQHKLGFTSFIPTGAKVVELIDVKMEYPLIKKYYGVGSSLSGINSLGYGARSSAPRYE